MTQMDSEGLWADVSKGAPQPPSLPNLKVVRLLGAGGFGAVWLCDQSVPLKRQVAVKVMRTVMAGPRLRSRFEAERRLLARMDHPGVARIFDAGETADGNLYFVMELVQGEPLVDWCDRHRFTLEQRVKVARQVCAAIQHAHSKGVVHLDIKPSNILVCEVDGAPVAKVIDFGVARLSEDPDAVSTLAGPVGPMGTLEYMAPEQLKGTRELDTRSDIYSMGVTLYQLFTGLTPFESRQLRAAGTVEAHRIICEREPESPSLRIARANAIEPAEAQVRATARGLTPQRLVRAVRGQLDAVVGRALEKRLDDRYPTCDALSDDLQRWLNQEPVHARPASLGLRMRKFARRNRIALSAASLVLLALVGGLAAMGYGLVEANRQLTRAERLRSFNNQMLKSVSPDIAKGMDTRLLKLIFDQSMGSIDQQYADDPLLAADAHVTAGEAYLAIGEPAIAIDHFKSQYEILSTRLPADDLDLLMAENDYAHALILNNKIEEAAGHLEHVLARRRELLGEDSSCTLSSMHNLAWLRDEQNLPKEALTLYQDVARRKREVLGADDDSTLQSMHNLAELQRRLGDLPAAKATMGEVVDRRIKLQGKESLDALLSRNNYCMVVRSMQDLAQAEPLFKDLIVDMEKALGPEHPYALIAQNNLASIYRDTNRLAEAEATYRLIIPRFVNRYGTDGQYTLAAQGNLALALEMQDKTDEARQVYEDTLARKRVSQGNKAATTAITMINLGILHWNEKRIEEAHRLFEEAWLVSQEQFPSNSPQYIKNALHLGATSLRLGDPKRAADLTSLVIAKSEATLPGDLLVFSKATLGEAQLAQSQNEEARATLESAYELASKRQGSSEPVRIAKLLAQVAERRGDAEGFERWTKLGQAAQSTQSP